jgi:sugar lactone lactonase YvrE
MKSPSSSSARWVASCVALSACWAAPAGAQSDYAAPYAFTTLAGSASQGSTDGPTAAARLYWPEGIAVDQAGNLYAADTGNHTIRKITPAGTVTTLAGVAMQPGSTDGAGRVARFDSPRDVAVDDSGNVFVADWGNHTIRRISPAGVVTTVAGTAGQMGGTDGVGAAARFSRPEAIAVDRGGNLYVSDSGMTVRKITPGGVVTTLAGTWSNFGAVDGVGSAASFSMITGLAVDAAGNVYVADEWNVRIRKITPSGVVSTVAREALDATDGSGLRPYPQGVAVDNAGNLYVALDQQCCIQKITPAGVVSTLAGSAFIQGSTDGEGSAARFNYPKGLAVDAGGNLFVADFYNNSIRRVSSAGTVTTVAGLAPDQSYGSLDGTGGAARFRAPRDVVLNAAGTLFVADRLGALRQVSPTGSVTTVPLNAPDFSPISIAVFPPVAPAYLDLVAITLDVVGNFYGVSNSGYFLILGKNEYAYAGHAVCRITPAGQVTVLAGDPSKYTAKAVVDGTAALAQFGDPRNIVADTAGNLYVTDMHAIRRITPGGAVATWVGSALESGYADGSGGTARFHNPGDLAIDPAGNIFVSDLYNYTIRRINPAGTVTTLAGRGGTAGTVDGTGSAARFQDLGGLAVDGTGYVYVADTGLIRRISATGEVTTLAGRAGVIGTTDGIGSEVRFGYSLGIAVDAQGTLYVADASNNTIREGRLAGAPVFTTQPQQQTVAVGGNVLFSVLVRGVPEPTYQWYCNGNPYTGATTTSLSFSNARSSDAGDYTVVATNALCSVTSTKATLTVLAPAPPPSSGGGGGGASSSWFFAALLILAAVNWFQRRGMGDWNSLP